MIVAPLIFSSLVAGIGGASAHGKRIGRMGFRAIVYFEVVTALALVVGLAAVNLTKPGVGVVLPVGEAPGVEGHPQTWDQILLHAVPESIAQAWATNDVLQIVIFALFFGIAVGRIGDKGKPIIAFMESVTEAMFVLTNGIMHARR